MERLELPAQAREGIGTGASRRLRRVGRVPAIFYGPGRAPQPLSVAPRDLHRVLGTASGANALITLSVPDLPQVHETTVLVKDLHVDAMTRSYVHVDFYAVSLTEIITVEVPVHLVGRAEGAKVGGVVQPTLRLLTIRCLPTEIPETLDVDVTPLMIGDSIHVRDLKVPTGIEVVAAGDMTVVTILAPVVEEARPAVAEEAPLPATPAPAAAEKG